ncbi:MAG: 50S ribosomal protein L11 methyltransferase [Verrucomicrobia bacterium]|nr:50S ribosomal protein L11 methyltransferase [Verrucomicrobiota bacterium]
MYRWTRLSSQKWEDVWEERLQFLGPGRVAMVTWPDSKALKIETFTDKRTAESLANRFGGRVTKVAAHILAGNQSRPRAPLAIRGRLWIYSDEASWKRAKDKPGAVWIPAGMAFGTGEHATTATCLRLLCDVAKDLPEGWRVMDAGTGSGILGIAAEKLGASAVEAFDFDPVCVRISKENARNNGCRRIKITKADARKITAFQRADVILANLFSELLLASAPGFARKLPKGGWLIFSGVLRKQADEVCEGLVRLGFDPPRVIARGKWCAGVTRMGVAPATNTPTDTTGTTGKRASCSRSRRRIPSAGCN